MNQDNDASSTSSQRLDPNNLPCFVPYSGSSDYPRERRGA